MTDMPAPEPYHLGEHARELLRQFLRIEADGLTGSEVMALQDARRVLYRHEQRNQ